MPKTLYCWRCRMDMPMLDDAEWLLVAAAFKDAMPRTNAYREEHGVSLGRAREMALADVLAVYREITGWEEANPNALWHHRISLYGPPCRVCDKVLRTPVARHCVECGAARAECR